MSHLVDTLSRTLSAAAILGLVGILAVGPEAFAQTPPATATPEMRAAIETCRPDIERFCPGTQPGDGRIIACMRDHRAEMTPACRAAALSAVQARAAATRAATSHAGGGS